MKEAFWGVLVVMLGLFGIVVVNVLQQVTVDNERVYYVLKESTEASTYESMDLGYYRLNGVYRIVEEKFIENLIERYSTNIVDAKDYTIIVHDVNELPPFVSLRVESGISAIQNGFMKGNNNVNIVNAINGVIEAKYNLEELINFLGITKEEWMEMTSKNNASDGNYCNELFDEESECINGDINFLGFSDPTFISKDAVADSYVCDDTNPGDAYVTASYKVCECNKWGETITTDEIEATPNKENGLYVYTWDYTINEGPTKITKTNTVKLKNAVCTTGISLYPERDKDNGILVGDCNSGVWIGVRNYKGTDNDKVNILPRYTPSNAVNRDLKWQKINDTDNKYTKLVSSNPSFYCVTNKITNDKSCQSKSTLISTNTKNVEHGTIFTVKATTTKQKNTASATCNLKVDNTAPTCSITVSGGKAVATYNDVGAGVYEVGANRNTKATYTGKNNTPLNNGSYSDAINGTGYYYGYVKDAVGNTSSCKTDKEVTNAPYHQQTCSSTYSCGCALQLCASDGGGSGCDDGACAVSRTCWCARTAYCTSYYECGWYYCDNGKTLIENSYGHFCY